MPSIGLTAAVRVCDRCYNDSEGIFIPSNDIYSPCVGPNESNSKAGEICTEKPLRQRQKRSIVVDELAKKVQASGLTCS